MRNKDAVLGSETWLYISMCDRSHRLDIRAQMHKIDRDLLAHKTIIVKYGKRAERWHHVTAFQSMLKGASRTLI